MSKKSVPMSDVPVAWRMVRGFAIFYFLTRGLESILAKVMHPAAAAVLAFVGVSSLIVFRLHGLD